MGALKIYKGKDHTLIVQGSKNAKSKEKKKVKEKYPKSDNEDEGSNPTDEGLNSSVENDLELRPILLSLK